MGILSFTVLLYGVVTGMIIVMIPLYSVKIGGNQFDVGVIVSSYGLTYVLSSIWIGIAADRFGRERVFVAGMIGYLACMLLYTGARRPFDLVLIRAFQGFTDTPYWIIPIALATETYPPRVGRNIGQISAAQQIGLSIGPILAGALIESIDFPSPFYICALIVFLAIIMALISQRTNLVGSLSREASLGKGTKITRAVIQPCIGITMGAICFGVVVSQLVLYATRLLGNGLSAGALYAGFFLFNALVQAPAGRLWENTGARRNMIGFFFGIMSLSFFSLALMATVPVLVIATLILSACEGAVAVMLTISVMARAPPRDRGFYSSIQNIAWGIGYFVGPLIAGFLALNGTEMAFLFAGVISLAMLPLSRI